MILRHYSVVPVSIFSISIAHAQLDLNMCRRSRSSQGLLDMRVVHGEGSLPVVDATLLFR